MGIVSSGIGTGILFCVPSFQFLIVQVGWRMTYRIMAFFIPLIVISIVIVFLRRPLETTSSPQTKIATPHTITKDPFIVNEEWTSHPWTVRRAINTQPFWLRSLSYLLGTIATQSILTHYVAFFDDQGLEHLSISYIIGIIGLVSIGGKILWGALSDKIGREVTYTMGITCNVFGMISLILFNMVHSTTLPYIYAFFFSMGYAMIAVLPPLITADFFGGKAYGRLFGTLMIVNGVGSAFGAWVAGFLHDQAGSYFPVFIIMIAFVFASCLNIWRAAPRKIRMVPGKRDKIITR
jgi:sugar phosphate permease